MSCQILGSSTLNFIMWHTWINLTSKFIVQETNHQSSPKKHIWSIHWFVVVTNFLHPIANWNSTVYWIKRIEYWTNIPTKGYRGNNVYLSWVVWPGTLVHIAAEYIDLEAHPALPSSLALLTLWLGLEQAVSSLVFGNNMSSGVFDRMFSKYIPHHFWSLRVVRLQLLQSSNRTP